MKIDRTAKLRERVARATGQFHGDHAGDPDAAMMTLLDAAPELAAECNRLRVLLRKHGIDDTTDWDPYGEAS